MTKIKAAVANGRLSGDLEVSGLDSKTYAPLAFGAEGERGEKKAEAMYEEFSAPYKAAFEALEKGIIDGFTFGTGKGSYQMVVRDMKRKARFRIFPFDRYDRALGDSDINSFKDLGSYLEYGKTKIHWERIG